MFISLSASQTKLRDGLTPAVAQITYDTKLTLPEPMMKQFFQLFNKCIWDNVNNAEYLILPTSMLEPDKTEKRSVHQAAAQISHGTGFALSEREITQFDLL